MKNRRAMTQDHELMTISRMFDLVATLPADRRESVLRYVASRLADMPVIAQIDTVKAADPLLDFAQNEAA